MHAYILASNQAVAVEVLDDVNGTQAACYTTMAAAAFVAKGGVITDLRRWVEGTYLRARMGITDRMVADYARWVRMIRERYGLLAPVCDLLFLGIVSRGESRDERVDTVPHEVREAAVLLVGHDVGQCAGSCRICTAGSDGDWTWAIRLAAGDDAERVVAALADGYRAARRGCLIPAVVPTADVDGRYIPRGRATYRGIPDDPDF